MSEALAIPRKKANDPQVENHCSKRCHHFQFPCISSWNLYIRPQVWGCKFLRGKWKWTFAVFGRLHKFSDDFYFLDIWQCARYFVAALFKELASWGLESRTSRSRSRLLWQSRSRLEIWARCRSWRLRSRLHHCLQAIAAFIAFGFFATLRYFGIR